MLHGIRVVDLSHFLAGPFGTQLLADFGAEVIKVETGAGDSTRSIPPHFVGEHSAYFLSLNRNKKSILLNLKEPDGLSVLKDLIANADVVVDSFRDGVLERLGLDIDEILREHPSVIWCSISGFGKGTSHAQRPAYDMVVQAASGVMSTTGIEESGPVRVGPPIGDVAAGLYAAFSISTAIAARARTGTGTRIDIPMFSAQVSILSYLTSYYFASGTSPGLQGRSHESIPTYRAFRCADDRWIAVCAVTQAMWHALTDVLGNPELRHERFATAADRHENRSTLTAILDQAFLTRGAHEWSQLLEAANVPVSEVQSIGEALNSPISAELDLIASMSGPGVSATEVVRSPVRVQGLPVPSEAEYPPSLGAHTMEVLKDILGLSSQNISDLRDAGALR